MPPSALRNGVNVLAVRLHQASGSPDASFDAALVATGATADTVAPSVPTGLASPTRTSTTVGLTWTASTDDVGCRPLRGLGDGAPVGTTTGTSLHRDRAGRGQHAHRRRRGDRRRRQPLGTHRRPERRPPPRHRAGRSCSSRGATRGATGTPAPRRRDLDHGRLRRLDLALRSGRDRPGGRRRGHPPRAGLRHPLVPSHVHRDRGGPLGAARAGGPGRRRFGPLPQRRRGGEGQHARRADHRRPRRPPTSGPVWPRRSGTPTRSRRRRWSRGPTCWPSRSTRARGAPTSASTLRLRST